MREDEAPAAYRRYFGAIRIAPSRRMASPLSISLRTISATSDAYSAGRPNRGGNGTILPSDSCTSLGRLPIIGVSKRPGAMVTTRMPLRASSRAIGSVRPTSPPFDALYAACPICPSYAATDAVKTITPRSPPPLGVLRAIASAARRAMLNDPIRLMLIVRANEARLCGPSLPSIFSPCTTPAQLTMPCSAPNALCAASTAALPLASSVTSVRTNFAAAPSSLASALPSRSLTSASTAFPPPATTIRAVAAPRPDAPPLITKTLPRSSIVLLRCPIRSAAAARARANAGAGRRRALLFLRLEYGRRRRHQPGQVGQVRRHDQRVIGLGEIGERGDVLLGDLQVDGVDAAGRDDRLRDLANRLGVRFGDRQDRRRLTLRGVDLGLLDAFRL